MILKKEIEININQWFYSVILNNLHFYCWKIVPYWLVLLFDDFYLLSSMKIMKEYLNWDSSNWLHSRILNLFLKLINWCLEVLKRLDGFVSSLLWFSSLFSLFVSYWCHSFLKNMSFLLTENGFCFTLLKIYLMVSLSRGIILRICIKKKCLVFEIN